uniref:Uncharacterized protein n=1 Tax=Nelumbo nucifera TaxID=4432 RepID=A0A822XFP8_NELNU|nr:TPA_asm: hypothetical protein HUJ06_019394 [Nelumbo nucifera]
MYFFEILSPLGELRMEEMPLPALFEQARKIHSMASESGVDQEMLRKGCDALRQCEEMTSKLGLFSINEAKDEISTANLKYLLVLFLFNVPFPDMKCLNISSNF